MSRALQIPPSNLPVVGPDNKIDQRWYNFFTALVDRAGGIVGALQPADDTLDALAALNNTAGLVTETAADTFTKRSVAGVAAEIVVTNGNGAAGNPTVGLANVAGVAGTYAFGARNVTIDGKGRVTAVV